MAGGSKPKVVHIAGFKGCPFYNKAKNLADSLTLLFPEKLVVVPHELADRPAYVAWAKTFRNSTPAFAHNPVALVHSASPFCWFGTRGESTGTDDVAEYLGGYDEAVEWSASFFAPKAPSASVDMVPDGHAPGHGYDYDLVVIGGGSGGMACAKAVAGNYDVKVALLDFVKPSPHGTEWGLGGTCVNVGCIPKKLMHRAAQLKEAVLDAESYGWQLPAQPEHQWGRMVNSVQDHIASLNFGYRTELRSANVTYLNALATFDDEHTVLLTDKKGGKTKATAACFLIAVGGRPKYPDIPGDRECCITSDDLFSLTKPPGRTLVVGASYVALECAGFLTALGYDTSVMMRSIPLRGFDQECAAKIVEHMEEHGTRFIRGCVPTKFERQQSGAVRVTFSKGGGEEGAEHDDFDTVLLAIGRYALTQQLNLEKVGVEVDKRSLKVVNPADASATIGDTEQSTCPHIFAVGDVLEGRPELTPVAIKAGQRLAQRLFSTGAGQCMDYDSVATTVFTPIEYGCVGWSEEEAEERLGSDNLEVFHSLYTPLEWAPPSEQAVEQRAGRHAGSTCFAKVLVARNLDDRVVGIHLVGEHAGEIVQGFALAIKHKISKQDLDDLVGIHPTSAEVLTTLTVTKRSGVELKMSGC